MNDRNKLAPGAVLIPFGFYLIWTLATWLFEGLPGTLVRPDAVGLRAAYAWVVNIGIGVVGTGYVLVALNRRQSQSPKQMGFRRLPRALGAVLTGLLLAILMFMVQRPPVSNPVVIANAFAQVAVVTVAEVLVCWVLVGVAVERGLAFRFGRTAPLIAAATSSVLFGVYHIAHSPPFNEGRMIVLLMGVGVLTSFVFFVGRDVYATVIIHNVFALKGVLAALVARGEVRHLERLSWPLLITAAVSALLLVGLHRLVTQQAPGIESA